MLRARRPQDSRQDGNATCSVVHFDWTYSESLWNNISNARHGDTQMIPLKVNGEQRSFDGDPDLPLLWYLRDVLGLTGTKFGCGMALCGACTVHRDGKAIRSCITSMSKLGGAEITTIEGISKGKDGLHPVQQKWIEFNVPQCGYCQSGQIMQAVSLLKEKPKPTDEDIEGSMSGNICRCGTYQRIRAAIKSAAGEKA
jgi:isoquinoline 1-oxidoreductase alpha subunit